MKNLLSDRQQKVKSRKIFLKEDDTSVNVQLPLDYEKHPNEVVQRVIDTGELIWKSQYINEDDLDDEVLAVADKIKIIRLVLDDLESIISLETDLDNVELIVIPDNIKYLNMVDIPSSCKLSIPDTCVIGDTEIVGYYADIVEVRESAHFTELIQIELTEDDMAMVLDGYDGIASIMRDSVGIAYESLDSGENLHGYFEWWASRDDLAAINSALSELEITADDVQEYANKDTETISYLSEEDSDALAWCIRVAFDGAWYSGAAANLEAKVNDIMNDATGELDIVFNGTTYAGYYSLSDFHKIIMPYLGEYGSDWWFNGPTSHREAIISYLHDQIGYDIFDRDYELDVELIDFRYELDNQMGEFRADHEDLFDRTVYEIA